MLPVRSFPQTLKSTDIKGDLKTMKNDSFINLDGVCKRVCACGCTTYDWRHGQTAFVMPVLYRRGRPLLIRNDIKGKL